MLKTQIYDIIIWETNLFVLYLQKYILNKYYMKKILQKLAIYILKKTNYKFEITHDDFDIRIEPNGLTEITRYDLICSNKNIGFIKCISLSHYFCIDDMFDTQNIKTKGVIIHNERNAKEEKENYLNIINEVRKSAKVKI